MASDGKIETEFEKVISDNTSGSRALAIMVCGLFERFSSQEPEKVRLLGEKLYSHYTGVGLVRNTIIELLGAMTSGSEIGKISGEIRNRINHQAARAVENIAPLFRERISLVTISRSSQVEEAIIRYSDRIEEVYVLESRPMLEGVGLHNELTNRGINATLLTDASMKIACGNADISLVGCDSFLGDGTLIHKTGTFPLFALMHYYSRPNYSLGMGMKEEKQWTKDSYPGFREHSCRELGISGDKCLNQYFELIPRTLIDGFCNETGFTDLDGE